MNICLKYLTIIFLVLAAGDFTIIFALANKKTRILGYIFVFSATGVINHVHAH